MANNYFNFKQFTIRQTPGVFRVTTDSVLLGAWSDLDGSRHILDIGTGTGILALMAAQRSGASIVAVEPDEGSFIQAAENFRNSPWSNLIEPVNLPVDDYVPHPGILFDAIIANPPFFNDSLLNDNDRKARARHSITLSHEGLVSRASELLAPHGALNIILPVREALLLVEKAADMALSCYRKCYVIPRPGVPPSRLMISIGRGRENQPDSELVIESGGRHVYSKEYIDLTRDFYLNF